MFGYEDEASSVPAEDKEAEAIIEEETTELFQHLFKTKPLSSDRWVKLLLCLM